MSLSVYILLVQLEKFPRTLYVCAGQSGAQTRHGCVDLYPVFIFANKHNTSLVGFTGPKEQNTI